MLFAVLLLIADIDNFDIQFPKMFCVFPNNLSAGILQWVTRHEIRNPAL